MPENQAEGNNYNFIDLFAGAGGLSEGFIQANFSPIAYVEMNKFAAQTLITRCAYYYLKDHNNLEWYYRYLRGELTREEFLIEIPKEIQKIVICETMANNTLPNIFNTIDEILKEKDIKKVDVIIGGPPCQAYSYIGRAQNSHIENDPRNELYKLYARFLIQYQPKMFIFENVMGIISAKKGEIWKSIQNCFKKVGYEIECHEQNSKNFGVLQNRKRMIIVGWLKHTNLHYPVFKQIKSEAIVNDLFTDLPALTPGKGASTYSKKTMSKYIIDNNIRTSNDILTLHQSRLNNERDIKIYKRVIELWNKEHKRLKYNDLPEVLKTHKNRTCFVDRYKIVEGDEPCCHTILAHLSKDGHYFIHPDINQHRSITVREAARIQSFPDNYYFEGPRTAQFIQIGNAVPPIMAKGIAEGIKEELSLENKKI